MLYVTIILYINQCKISRHFLGPLPVTTSAKSLLHIRLPPCLYGRLFVRSSTCISARVLVYGLLWNVILGTFMKIFLGNPNLFEIGKN